MKKWNWMLKTKHKVLGKREEENAGNGSGRFKSVSGSKDRQRSLGVMRFLWDLG